MEIKTDMSFICETEEEIVYWVRMGNDGYMISINKEDDDDP